MRHSLGNMPKRRAFLDPRPAKADFSFEISRSQLTSTSQTNVRLSCMVQRKTRTPELDAQNPPYHRGSGSSAEMRVNGLAKTLSA
jgi:hypothetical protein